MQMRKILCSPSLAFNSALVKYTASELGLFDLNHNCKIYFSGSSTVCSTAGPSGYARSILTKDPYPALTQQT